MHKIIQWRNEFSVGVPVLDEQHKTLVALIAEVQRILKSPSQTSQLGAVLKELVEYTKLHFRTEERLMAELEYADIADHCRLHREMTNQVVKILLDLKAGKDLDALELFEFLRHWLVEHILHEDLKIGEDFRSKRPSQVQGTRK